MLRDTYNLNKGGHKDFQKAYGVIVSTRLRNTTLRKKG